MVEHKTSDISVSLSVFEVIYLSVNKFDPTAGQHYLVHNNESSYCRVRGPVILET